MPLARLLLLPLTLFHLGPPLARARIGESLEQCRQRYGAPFLSDPGHTAFRESGLVIVVTFYEGQADSVTYFKAEGDAQKHSLPLSDDEQQALLRANGGEHVWQKTPDPTPNLSWTTDDGGLSAQYDFATHILGIATKEALEREAAAKEAEENVQPGDS